MAWQGADAAPVSPRQSGFVSATLERDCLVPRPYGSGVGRTPDTPRHMFRGREPISLSEKFSCDGAFDHGRWPVGRTRSRGFAAPAGAPLRAAFGRRPARRAGASRLALLREAPCSLRRIRGDIRTGQPRRDVPPRLRGWPALPASAAKFIDSTMPSMAYSMGGMYR